MHLAGTSRFYKAGMAARLGAALMVLAWLLLAGGCARRPVLEETPLKARTLSELQGYLLSHPADLSQFKLRGPFDVVVHKDRELRLSVREHYETDLYLSAHAEKAPLIIILHGNDGSKEAHTYQALHLASWGMHCLTVQLPNNGPWVENGEMLAKIVKFISQRPESVDSRIDVNKIVLVGHSYGGSAVAIALAQATPAQGAILLDPAVVGGNFPSVLRRIDKPVMLLGADEHVSKANHRDYFYRFIPRGIYEISIKDASHEDAQYPSQFSLDLLGVDPYTTEELQQNFVTTLTASAFSLSSTGIFDYAWNSFAGWLNSGELIIPKKK